MNLSFSPNSSVDAEAALRSMTNCLSDVRTWMATEKLMLNNDKTVFMLIGTTQRLAKVDIAEVLLLDLLMSLQSLLPET